jgi:hypothetical protein
MQKYVLLIIAFGTIVLFQNCGNSQYALYDSFSKREGGPQLVLSCDICLQKWQAMNFESAPALAESYQLAANDEMVILWQDPDSTGNGTIHIYQIASDSWSQVDSPIAFRAGSQIISLQDRIYLWGGYLSPDYLNDGLMILNGQQEVTVMDSDLAPSGRVMSSVTPLDNGFFLFGGYDGINYLNDTYLFDSQLNEWILVEEPSLLSARVGHKSVLIGNEVLVWGGYYQAEANSDIIFLDDGAYFDISTKEWRSLDATSPPAGRLDFGLGYNQTSNSVFVYGGILDADYFGVDKLSLTGSEWFDVKADTAANSIFSIDLTGVSDRYLFAWSDVGSETYIKGAFNVKSGVWEPLPEITDLTSFEAVKLFATSDRLLMIGLSDTEARTLVGYYIYQ